MPINYKKYPANWKEIRQRILERAENKCEKCGLQNRQIVASHKGEDKKVIWVRHFLASFLKNKDIKAVKVVLTIAHLDHDEVNHDVKDERLAAMCQLCHLRYDIEEKKKRKLTAKNKTV